MQAVQEFGAMCHERDSDIVKGVLPYWPRIYCKISMVRLCVLKNIHVFVLTCYIIYSYTFIVHFIQNTCTPAVGDLFRSNTRTRRKCDLGDCGMFAGAKAGLNI